MSRRVFVCPHNAGRFSGWSGCSANAPLVPGHTALSIASDQRGSIMPSDT